MDQVTLQNEKMSALQNEFKEWKAKPDANKTWDNFKTHFRFSYHDHKEEEAFG